MGRSRLWLSICATTLLTASPAAAAPDPVLEWMKITNDTVLAAGTTALFTGRPVALVSAAVFDAVNGIERRYQPILRIKDSPARHASQRAAAIQAAYVILTKLYPTALTLTAKRDTSILALASGPGAESSTAIQNGITWGGKVAEAIWLWRSTDGFNPNPAPGFLGSLGRPVPGVWRPTPRGDGATPTSASGPQIAIMTPWVILRANQFRPAAPYASPTTGQIDLTNAQYLADYQETKLNGSYATRLSLNDDHSKLALFWNGNTPLFWIRIALQISPDRHLTMSQNARLFALLNLAMADAAIACWDAKFRFVLWRPITAIREGTFDPDPTWKPWLDSFAAGTPAHPESPSGHSTVSGAAAFILAAAFGDYTAFTIDSDTLAGTRSFPSFSAALEEIHDARVFGGIHWRSACRIGSAIGQAVAAYVSTHVMRSGDDDNDDDRR